MNLRLAEKLCGAAGGEGEDLNPMLELWGLIGCSKSSNV